MGKKIAIVGAGVGGLSTAARLAKSGWQVEVFEKLSKCGGRNNIIEERGFKFDTGPSFVLMPDFFQEIFSYCADDLKNYLNLKVLDVNYKIFYPDGTKLTVYRDTEKLKEELEKIERGSSRAYDNFINETAGIYKQVRPLLYKCLSKKDLFNFRYWFLIKKIRALENYWQLVSKFFKSDKLRYAFTFEAMFIGVSPHQAPAFYSVITYADQIQKIHHPLGGMYQIPLALEKLAKKFDVRLNYNYEVEKIEQRRGKIILRTGKTAVEADKVVVNADYAYAQTDLLKRHISSLKYSCSVFLLYLGLKKKIEALEHHNLFFSKNLTENLNQIFKAKTIPQDPSFYVHVPTKTDDSVAPGGKDLIYILIPVPNLHNKGEKIEKQEEALKNNVFDRINKVLSIKLQDLIEVEHKFYPEDFILRYNIKYAATFGLAHNLMQSAFFRPQNYDARIKNLYYVGASTQPGGGLPVVIAGSKIVCDLINAGK